MNIVANHPVMTGIAGLNWWTSIQADEDSVRFVGKLYRHYGIDARGIAEAAQAIAPGRPLRHLWAT